MRLALGGMNSILIIIRIPSVQVVPEPVDKWQDIGNGHHNVLQAFYDTPDRYAYTFQNYVFVTRMMQVCSQCFIRMLVPDLAMCHFVSILTHSLSPLQISLLHYLSCA